MELELKHIAPYLPYRVEIYELNVDGRNTFTLDIDLLMAMQIGGFEYFKPILRPMSDLIEDCINGECPLNIIKERYNELNEERIQSVEFHNIGGVTLYGMLTDDSYEVSMPLWAYDMLFSWHFDVFGLIDAGLAVELKDN